jgi:hypothetical protein
VNEDIVLLKGISYTSKVHMFFTLTFDIHGDFIIQLVQVSPIKSNNLKRRVESIGLHDNLISQASTTNNRSFWSDTYTVGGLTSDGSILANEISNVVVSNITEFNNFAGDSTQLANLIVYEVNQEIGTIIDVFKSYVEKIVKPYLEPYAADIDNFAKKCFDNPAGALSIVSGNAVTISSTLGGCLANTLIGSLKSGFEKTSLEAANKLVQLLLATFILATDFASDDSEIGAFELIVDTADGAALIAAAKKELKK